MTEQFCRALSFISENSSSSSADSGAKRATRLSCSAPELTLNTYVKSVCPFKSFHAGVRAGNWSEKCNQNFFHLLFTFFHASREIPLIWHILAARKRIIQALHFCCWKFRWLRLDWQAITGMNNAREALFFKAHCLVCIIDLQHWEHASPGWTIWRLNFASRFYVWMCVTCSFKAYSCIWKKRTNLAQAGWKNLKLSYRQF